MSEGLLYNLRPSRLDDMALLFNWANDPIVRNNSRNPNTITWVEHAQWYRKFLVADDKWQFILEVNDEPVGQIRVEGCEISFSVESSSRGLGYGTLMLQMVVVLMRQRGIYTLFGMVKIDNMVSQYAFRKAGWVSIAVEDSDMLCFLYEVPSFTL